jgi:hypothetical protein
MASAGVVIGVLFVLGLFILGAAQSWHGQLPRSSLAGAAIVEKTQQELNICMNKCMRACVTREGTEPACLDSCNKTCGVSVS